MSTFKGTPGPWQAVNGTDIFTPLAARNGAGTAAHETDGWHIADCSMGETQTEDGAENIPHREQLANARLIAAAPELLEALQDALSFVAAWASAYQNAHGLPDFDPRHKESIEQVKYAIAKATGGAA